MGAYQQFQSQALQVKHYEGGILKQAQDVLEGKIYSYNRGEVSLLEILNAQRTYDEVQAQYIETLFNYNAALVDYLPYFYWCAALHSVKTVIMRSLLRLPELRK